MAWWIIFLGLILLNFLLIPAQLIALCTFLSGALLFPRYEAGGMVTRLLIVGLNVVLLSVAAISLGVLVMKGLKWAGGGMAGDFTVGIFGFLLAVFPIWQVRRLLAHNSRYEPESFAPKIAVYKARFPALIIVAAVLFWLNMNDPVLESVFLPLMGIGTIVVVANLAVMMSLMLRGESS